MILCIREQKQLGQFRDLVSFVIRASFVLLALKWTSDIPSRLIINLIITFYLIIINYY